MQTNWPDGRVPLAEPRPSGTSPNEHGHPNQGASEAAIQNHYDVSNEFYRLWLGPTLTYSCALWEAGDDLDSAQLRKLDYHVDQAGAAGAGRILDVGCGWGSLLRRLVDRHGVRHAVGLTLSRRQYEWVRTADDPRIQALLESWVEHRAAEPYDAIISIGAFEHFSRLGVPREGKIAGYRHFFRRCHQWLRSGGRVSLQTVVYENFNERDPNPFVAEVFPESDLPRLADLVTASEGMFEIVRLQNNRRHYVDTLRTWFTALKANRQAAVALVGEQTVRKYEKYLGVFIVGFHTGTVNLSRITLQRIDRPCVAPGHA